MQKATLTRSGKYKHEPIQMMNCPKYKGFRLILKIPVVLKFCVFFRNAISQRAFQAEELQDKQGYSR